MKDKGPVADLVDYRKGSIVSRRILQKDAGSMTLFAFDAGQELSEHVSPYEAVIHVVDGAGKVQVAGEWSDVKSGEMILLPAGKPHAVRAAKRFKMILTMIRSKP